KRLSVPLSDLEEPVSGAARGPRLPPGVTLSRPAGTGLPGEIQLIGKRVEEALELLDKNFDDACLASLSPVRVIHGIGTGRLRSPIRRFLESHPQVEGFVEAEERDGRGAVTVVRLRI